MPLENLFTQKQPSDTIVNSTVEFLAPENVCLDTKIIIEPEIQVYTRRPS